MISKLINPTCAFAIIFFALLCRPVSAEQMVQFIETTGRAVINDEEPGKWPDYGPLRCPHVVRPPVRGLRANPNSSLPDRKESRDPSRAKEEVHASGRVLDLLRPLDHGRNNHGARHLVELLCEIDEYR